jgi:NAD(P)-dependent dehydrogenase (short-subunit alcohol dehydrogenase family)
MKLYKNHLMAMILLSVFLAFANPYNLHAKEAQKAVLVTGATSGIGLSITKHLSQTGHFVYAGARKDADMKRLNKLPNVQAIRLDVNKPLQIAQAVETVRANGKGLYGLVNNAGVVVLSPLIETSESDLDFQLQVNLYGPYRISRAFAPLIIESKGRISTISSISGILSGRLFGPYSMSKHAIEAFSDSLAIEMSKFQVKVSVIEPGNFESKIGDSFFKRFEKQGDSTTNSLYKQEWQGMLDYFKQRPTGADPITVAKAVEHALFDPKPKMRYMVVPNQREGDMTIRKAISEMVQLNQSHEFSNDRAKLIKILDEELAKLKQ